MNICPCIDTIYKGVDLTTALNEIKSLGYRGLSSGTLKARTWNL